MEDSFKFIYQNYSKAKSFEDYWYAFENYLDREIPHSGRDDTFRKRLQRFEEYLHRVLVHHVFLNRTFNLSEADLLAELHPRIFRESTSDTSAHEAFASDYSRRIRGQKPKEPICRLLNLLYTVRCNSQHGQKILPEEWEEIRKRNELVFSLTSPILAALDELIITFFVSTGIFAYGRLQHLETAPRFPFSVAALPATKIKGHLYDLGEFPAWRYETWGWVHGAILSVPLQFRAKFVRHCDAMEGKLFERRLTIAYGEEESIQHIAWAYHYCGETTVSQRIEDGTWKDPINRKVE